MKKKIFIKLISVCLSVFVLASVCMFSVAAQVTQGANRSKAYITISTKTAKNFTIYKLSCREKHTETGSKTTVTGFNSAGNATSIACVIKPNTGYRFIDSTVTYNFYKYSISGAVTGPAKLQWEE